MEKKIIVEEVVFDGIPCSIYHDDAEEVKPLIFFFHGFGGNHLNGILDKGHKLAGMGYYVVAMDAYLHGERATEEFKALDHAKRQKSIVDIYNIYLERKKINEQLKTQIKNICPILIKGSLEEGRNGNV